MTAPLNVLLVEDSATDAKLVIRELQRTGPVEFERVETEEALRVALERKGWDVVLSDWSMPKFTAPAALRIVREKLLDVPFIIVSGTIGEGIAVEAMRAGANDFVLKDKLARLAPAIERELRERKEREARRLAEENLQGTEDLLRAAVRARDEFLAIASHELRTPLTSLSLQVESLRRLLEDSKGQAVPVEKLEPKFVRVSHQVSRLTALVNNFLDVARITSGRMAPSPATADLREVVDAVLCGAREQIARSGSSIELRVEGQAIGEWDRLMLESAIFNLVSNAIKYGEGKPIDIEVGLRADHARLVVTDHGIGILVDEQERIFGRFERAVPQQHFGGFGLGLWVARKIIEAHRGTITVASELGLGSSFTVLLPLARGEDGSP